jgi:hypothetical protein
MDLVLLALRLFLAALFGLAAAGRPSRAGLRETALLAAACFHNARPGSTEDEVFATASEFLRSWLESEG